MLIESNTLASYAPLINEINRINEPKPRPEVHFIIRGLEGWCTRTRRLQHLLLGWPNLISRLVYALRPHVIQNFFPLHPHPRPKLEHFFSVPSQFSGLCYEDHIDTRTLIQVHKGRIQELGIKQVLDAICETEQARTCGLLSAQARLFIARLGDRNVFG